MQQTSHAVGVRAEAEAERFLVAKGCTLVGKRRRTPYGEIDLVFEHANLGILVEVKQRATLDAALEALSLRQRTRIVQAGTWLWTLFPHWEGLRFDVVAISPFSLQHLENAFGDGF